MKKRIFVKFVEKYPLLGEIEIPEINRRIFSYYSMFEKDEELLIVSLIQDLFGVNKNTLDLAKRFGEGVFQKMILLNDINNIEEVVIKEYKRYKKLATLYLVNFKISFENLDSFPFFSRFFTEKKAHFALQLLRKCSISEIVHELDDKFFYVLDPDLFNKYCSNLFLSRRTHNKCEQHVKRELHDVLSSHNIKGEVHCRLKSIYGIHKKVSEKNILLSQVLDIVGMRILTETEEESYAVMKAILEKWSSVNSKVKDYIAMPKDNGYRSIHLTILLEGSPVEIQIRTFEMHWYAQYGNAAHVNYKKSAHAINEKEGW